jgi:hypothetical protein
VVNALRRSGEQDAFGHVIPSLSNLALATRGPAFSLPSHIIVRISD